MQLAYALLLPDAVHNLVRDLQLAIGRALGHNPSLRLEPHLTLKQPFPAGALEPFAAILDALAAGTHAFEVRLTGVGIFPDGTLYLDVAQDPRLEALRRHLLVALAPHGVRPEEVENERYHSHITLAGRLPAAQRAAARAAVADQAVGARFRADTLGLFCNLSAEEWFVCRRRTVGP